MYFIKINFELFLLLHGSFYYMPWNWKSWKLTYKDKCWHQRFILSFLPLRVFFSLPHYNLTLMSTLNLSNHWPRWRTTLAEPGEKIVERQLKLADAVSFKTVWRQPHISHDGCLSFPLAVRLNQHLNADKWRSQSSLYSHFGFHTFLMNTPC